MQREVFVSFSAGRRQIFTSVAAVRRRRAATAAFCICPIGAKTGRRGRTPSRQRLSSYGDGPAGRSAPPPARLETCSAPAASCPPPSPLVHQRRPFKFGGGASSQADVTLNSENKQAGMSSRARLLCLRRVRSAGGLQPELL